MFNLLLNIMAVVSKNGMFGVFLGAVFWQLFWPLNCKGCLKALVGCKMAFFWVLATVLKLAILF